MVFSCSCFMLLPPPPPLRLYGSHSRKPSTTRSTSLRFFSKTANMKMMVAPVAIPATYQSQVQPKFTEAYQIMVISDSSRKTEPSSSNPRIRNMIPENTPANENAPRINGNHGELTTPLMKMSAVEDTTIVTRERYRIPRT